MSDTSEFEYPHAERCPFPRAVAGSVFALLLACSAALAAEALRNPIDGPLRPTSSFLEHRLFRFHAGVDFSVGGRKGVPYYAVESGYVWRVRVSPFGYGKAIYLRLADGRTIVYAHCDGFPQRIERLVRARQFRTQEYTVDLFLRPDDVPVRRGEVIAYSGETGIGVPHLHFEVRNAANQPVNPWANGLRVQDTVDPTMVALAFVPLDSRARANQSSRPLIVPLAKYDGVWSTRSRIELWGRVGVALAAWDRTHLGRYRLGLHDMLLKVDGDTIFERSYDRMSFPAQRMAIYDRNYYLLMGGEGRYYNLYIPRDNDLPFYAGRPRGSGVLLCGVPREPGGAATSLSSGRHEISIYGEDFAGNTASVHADVLVGAPPEIVSLRAEYNSETPVLRVTASDSLDFVRFAAAVSEDGSRWTTVETGEGDQWQPVARLELELPHDSAYVRIAAEDTLGMWTGCTGCFKRMAEPPEVEVRQWWGRDWCELELISDRPLRSLPHVSAAWQREYRVSIPAREVEPGLFEADVAPAPDWPRNYRLRILDGPAGPTILSYWNTEHASSGDVELVRAEQQTYTRYRGTVVFDEDFPDSGLVRIRADEFDTSLMVRGKTIGADGGIYFPPGLGASVELTRGVVPDPVFFRVERDTLVPSFAELEPVSDGWVFRPQRVPFLGSATVTVELPDTLDLDKVALYGYSSRGGDLLTVPEGGFDHLLRARVRSLPSVAAFRDVTPPRLSFARPRMNGVVRDRRPRIVAYLRDNGAGFGRGDEAMEMRLDGEWVPAEFDPEDGTFVYVSSEPLESGSHTVVVNARDLVGNESSAALRFRVE